MTTKEKEVHLSPDEIAIGVIKINAALTSAKLTAEPDGVGYETLYVDNYGETQGGWYVQFSKKSRDRLRECPEVSWQKVGMVSGDSLDSILQNLESLRTAFHKRPSSKPVSQTAQRKIDMQKQKAEQTKKALEVFHRTGVVTDEELRLCLDHYNELVRLIEVDPVLKLAKNYAFENLTALERYFEARKR